MAHGATHVFNHNKYITPVTLPCCIKHTGRSSTQEGLPFCYQRKINLSVLSCHQHSATMLQ